MVSRFWIASYLRLDRPSQGEGMRSRRTILTGVAVALAMTAVPAAQAAAGDRDGDRMPDRWERAHGLSTRTDDSARDPDHDHLSNYREYRLGTHPRERDSDHDGIRDGKEDADHDGVRNKHDRHRGNDHGDRDRSHDRHDSSDDDSHDDD
jgi:hypothetical protein